MLNNNKITIKKLQIIIFKNFKILNFGPESVIVFCCDSRSHSVTVCRLNYFRVVEWEPPAGLKANRHLLYEEDVIRLISLHQYNLHF